MYVKKIYEIFIFQIIKNKELHVSSHCPSVRVAKYGKFLHQIFAIVIRLHVMQYEQNDSLQVSSGLSNMSRK